MLQPLFRLFFFLIQNNLYFAISWFLPNIKFHELVTQSQILTRPAREADASFQKQGRISVWYTVDANTSKRSTEKFV